MSKFSRDKGKRGEREWAKFLRDHGIEARRGVQHKGGPGSPDVESSLPFHFEVKRTERFSVYDALEQARIDLSEMIPLQGSRVLCAPPVAVAHKRNGKPWVVCMYADEWLSMTE